MAWIVRVVKIGVYREEQCDDVMKFRRPDDLADIVNLGLTEADGKQLLASLQQRMVAAQA